MAIKPEFHVVPDRQVRQRVLIAAGPYWNNPWAALCPPEWPVVGTVDTLDVVPDAVRTHRPDILVLSQLCPGVADLASVVAQSRYLAPSARIVLVVESLSTATRQLIQTAAGYGVYHVIIGAPTPDEWFDTLSADRTIRDVLPYYSEAEVFTQTPPAVPRRDSQVQPGVSMLACAVGTLPDDLRQFLVEIWPQATLPDWQVTQVGDTTDEVWDSALAEGGAWTTLLVTIGLTGTRSLVELLGHVHRSQPHCRIAVVAGTDSPEVRQLIDECARDNLRNIYVSPTLDPDDLKSLVTEDWGPEHTAAYRTPTGLRLKVPTWTSAPAAVVSADPEVVAAQTVAVVSGKGGVGKTSFIANCLIAVASWGAVGIDADYVKPSLHLAFQSADATVDHDLDQLLASITAPTDALHPEWSARDRQTIREWVRQAWTVSDGVRLVSGPNRSRDVLSVVPPGLVTALAEAGQKTARLTLIDTPGSTMEQSWVEAVETADWIVLVTTPDYAAVLESIDVLRKLDYLHVPRSRVWLVINKRGKSGYSTDEIRHTHLKDLPVLAVIPDKPAEFHQAWRMHRPLALKEKRLWADIVQKMTGVEPDRPKRKNPFRLSRKPKTS